jgi:hypothetical protein
MRLIMLLLCLLLLLSTAQGRDYCSLVVKVVDPEGRRVGARVSVTEGDGRVETKETEGSDLSFCDLGILPVTVTVGHPACNQSIVRNVGLSWGQTTKTTVMYDVQPCLHDLPPVAACKMLLRFRDSHQSWLTGVALELNAPQAEVLKTDRYGRVLIRVPAGQAMRGRATAESFRPTEVDFNCTRERILFEQIVTLE